MTAILPGSMIGIMGGGQLGRMIALEAKRMGYRVAVLDPDADGPAAQVSDHVFEGDFDDVGAALELARISDVVTIDSEHIPASLLEELAQTTEVRPDASVLRTVQDRLLQRRFLATHDLPQTDNAEVSSAEDFEAASQKVGFPAVLKTRREGYDGKGQVRVDSADELPSAFEALGRQPAILEAFVHFDKEISVILARGLGGEIRFHDIAENVHRNHVLHTSHAPAQVSMAMKVEAERLGARIASELGIVGMMAVELFVTRDERLLVNEIAPRTHNSGHYTFGACATSQFEQHVRAICGLPLGDPTLFRPAVMLNLLGDLWNDGPPAWQDLVAHPGARLHLYGKGRASTGRKMGHVLIIDEALDKAVAIAESISAQMNGADPDASEWAPAMPTACVS